MKKLLYIFFIIAVMTFTTILVQSLSAADQPVRGGILKVIRGNFPRILGYTPEFTPIDSIYSFPVLERLANWDEKGNLIPVLAESWKVDPSKKTITWYLRKGIKFHDGTDWDAEACRWQFQQLIDTGRLPEGEKVKSMEVVDKYTLKMNLSKLEKTLVLYYGHILMTSPTAFTKAGEGDIEKSKEWARRNSVGTGPFKVVEYRRDDFIKYVKNENYWIPGRPYLDGIEKRFIPDPMTASAMMLAKEADAWFDVSAVEQILELEAKGFKVVWGPGMSWSLLPNSNDPKSPFADKRVREAVEYAIDRPAIAKMIGRGKFEPLHQMLRTASPGYLPGYNPRPYNPEKAKKLLAEAGYPNGFKTTILAMDAQRDTVAAFKSYLAAVGIDVKPDLTDVGRYNAAVFRTGWSDLAFAANGINPDATDIFSHFGPSPRTYRTGHIKKTPEYIALCNEALEEFDQAKHLEKVRKVVRQAGEDAMVIPVYISAQANVLQKYVHSDYIKIHSIVWYSHEDWMEKR